MYFHALEKISSFNYNLKFMRKWYLMALAGGLLTSSLFFSSCQSTKNANPEVNIIPKPVSLRTEKGTFTISPKTSLILLADSLKNSADFLNNYLNKYYGFELPVKKGSAEDTAASNAIILGNRKMSEPLAGGYVFHSDKDRIVIRGKDAPGTFYGIQTLIQLLPVTPSKSLDIARVQIKDYPRFGYRGMMLDCGRHFFDTAFIKKYIDFIAMHKMNTFHWHLTEDQGWRIQIKKYPKLTEVGAWRDSTLIGHSGQKSPQYDHHRYGGFYTQDEIRDIVKYAQKRYVTIIPEIEMPGHSLAAIASYPQLTCNPGDYHVATGWGVFSPILCPTPYTFKFYENVLDEVMDLFPSHYIHIGGDEAPKDSWKKSAFCKQLMKEKGFTSYDQIQSYFVHTIEKYLNAHGRDIIGWDEILEGGLAPNATVMSWRGEKGGIAAAKQQHDVIMTPTNYCYLDYSQVKNPDSLTIGGYLPLDTVYSYNPVGKLNSSEAKYVKGVQANVWTEYMEWPSKVEYMIFPRMEAISEVAWTPQKERNFKDFSDRLREAYKRYDLWDINYSKAFLNQVLKSDSTGTAKGQTK